MTPKTEAASLGEQIKDMLADDKRYSGCTLVCRLVALATSEPPAPQAVGERLSLTGLCVLETPDEDGGVEWGVSFYGSNPETEDYVACKSESDAWRLSEKVGSLIKALKEPT